VREGDVLLAIGGQPVANDGSVSEADRRFPFGLLVDRKQIGESVTLRLLREGQRIDVNVPLRALPGSYLRANAYDRRPRYYVYAGLVFVPLELEMLKTYGANWVSAADRTVLYEYLFRPREQPELQSEERVVLLRRLDHAVNANLNWYRNEVVERVNGKQITRLEDLIAAIEGNQAPYQVFEFSSFRRMEVLDRAAADRANQEILKLYGVDEDRHL
jgi:hypothetical protein